MNIGDLEQFDMKQVVVKLHDGSRRVGRFFVTPESGLYHVTRDSQRTGQIIGEILEDLRADDILTVEPLR